MITPLAFEEWTIYFELVANFLNNTSEQGQSIESVRPVLAPVTQGARNNWEISNKAALELTLITPPIQCRELPEWFLLWARQWTAYFTDVQLLLEAASRSDLPGFFDLATAFTIDARRIDETTKVIGSGEPIGDCNVR